MPVSRVCLLSAYDVVCYHVVFCILKACLFGRWMKQLVEIELVAFVNNGFRPSGRRIRLQKIYRQRGVSVIDLQ